MAYLNGLPGCKAENVSGNANQSGRPDINGCFHGRMFKIELKSPDHGYTTSKKQQLELRKWANVGCVIAVAYNLDFIRDLFENADWNSPYTLTSTTNHGSWYIIPKIQ